MKKYVGRSIVNFFISISVFPLLLSQSLFLVGCLQEGSGSEGDTQVVVEPGELPLPPYTPPERTVCDPFQAGVSARDRGLVGHLLYLKDDQPRYTHIDDYIENAHPIESIVYFDQVFIPTRAFDLGFYTQDGQLVLNHNDEPIYEYFALRLESKLTLSEAEEPGWYQMAVLSDDGSKIVEKLPDGSEEIIVDNGLQTATRMGCSVRSIYMDRETKKDIVLTYFQGPRYHIAMTVLWRPMPDGFDPQTATEDVECGMSGNSRFFHSTVVPSEPTVKYYELLERGWKPLSNQNYLFPEQASNPCATENPLLLTNFTVLSTTRTQVHVVWQTSLPASSQLEIKNISTGEVTLAPLDSIVKTDHSYIFSGLTSNTLYSVKALSVSEDGETAESVESAFRTPR